MASKINATITLLNWALILLRIFAVAAVGGFLAAMVLWRTTIWSDESRGEDGEDA